jgi:hypothetical protein
MNTELDVFYACAFLILFGLGCFLLFGYFFKHLKKRSTHNNQNDLEDLLIKACMYGSILGLTFFALGIVFMTGFLLHLF